MRYVLKSLTPGCIDREFSRNCTTVIMTVKNLFWRMGITFIFPLKNNPKKPETMDTVDLTSTQPHMVLDTPPEDWDTDLDECPTLTQPTQVDTPPTPPTEVDTPPVEVRTPKKRRRKDNTDLRRQVLKRRMIPDPDIVAKLMWRVQKTALRV